MYHAQGLTSEPRPEFPFSQTEVCPQLTTAPEGAASSTPAVMDVTSTSTVYDNHMPEGTTGTGAFITGRVPPTNVDGGTEMFRGSGQYPSPNYPPTCMSALPSTRPGVTMSHASSNNVHPSPPVTFMPPVTSPLEQV